MKQVLVKKFGGTSVGNPARLRSIVQIVSNAREKYEPIVVVSAVSATDKNRGTTSLLLSALNKAAAGQCTFVDDLSDIYAQHLALIDEVLAGELAETVKSQIKEELDKVSAFLNALSVIREASPSSVDLVVSVGEKMSAMLVAAALSQSSCSAYYCDLSQVLSELPVDSGDVSAGESDANWYNELASLFSSHLYRTSGSDFSKSVPVVTGFFGPVRGGLLERVGRGYSDLTGALIARGLGKERVSELQVWKEVDGVFSADPRKVPTAKVLSEISAIEAVELTFFGSEVLHPFTMEQVTSVGIPIRVLNSIKPLSAGTIIHPLSVNGRAASGQVTAVTAKRGVVVLSVTSNRMFDAQGFLASLFGILNEFDLVVDLVSTSEVTVSCTVNDSAKLRRAMPRLEELGTISVLENRAILAVVGEGLRHNIQSVATMCEALAASGLCAEMITQAETRTSISCVLPDHQVELGLQVVHDALFNQ